MQQAGLWLLLARGGRRGFGKVVLVAGREKEQLRNAGKLAIPTLGGLRGPSSLAAAAQTSETPADRYWWTWGGPISGPLVNYLDSAHYRVLHAVEAV